jgi:hypothetical protein
VGKRSLIGVVAVFVVLMASYSLTQLAGTVAQLRASAPRVRAPAPADDFDADRISGPAPSPLIGEQAAATDDVSGARLLPTDSGAGADEQAAESAQRRFDPDAALRAAIELDPEIGDLVNDPNPAVRSAISSFFEERE